MKKNKTNLKKRTAAVLALMMLAETVFSGPMVSLAETVPQETELTFDEEAAAEASEFAEDDAFSAAETAKDILDAAAEADDSAEETAKDTDGPTAPAFEEEVEFVAAVATEGPSAEERSDGMLLGFQAYDCGDGAPGNAETEIGFEVDEETGYIRSLEVSAPLKKTAAKSGAALLGTEGGIPEKFIPGKDEVVNYFTTPRAQGEFNTCWAFSTISLAEASMNMNAVKAGQQKPDPKYSELGLAYSMWNDRSIVDPLGLTKDDRGDTKASTYAQIGGNPLFSMMSLSGWKGVHDGNVIVYDDIKKPDFRMTSEECFDNAAVLKNSRVYELNDNESSRQKVKQAIMNYGGVTLEIYAGVEKPENYVQTGDGCCFWNAEAAKANHSVVAVGWNDSFRKENFEITEGTYKRSAPEKDGAWLIRNSRGTGFGDGGYFWLSYEDKSLGSSVVAMEFMDTQAIGNNYHYDGTAGNGTNTYSTKEDGKVKRNYYLSVGGAVGNIFRTAEKSAQELKAVSAGFATAGMGYSIQIYTNTAKMKNPTDGEPALKNPITGTCGEKGIYYIEIPASEDVYLTKGEYFSVVVTATSSPMDKNLAEMYTDKDLTDEDSTYLFDNATEEGQSYIRSFSDSGWVDMKKSSLPAMREWTTRIKAMTADVDTRPIYPESIELRDTVVTLGTSEPAQLVVTPANATYDSITWTIKDETVATVDESGLVRSWKKGDASLECTVRWTEKNSGQEKNLVKSGIVKVVDRPDSITLGTGEKNVKRGDSFTASVKAVLNGKEQSGTKNDCYIMDYHFDWSSSDPSIAAVTKNGEQGLSAYVNGKALGEALVEVTCREEPALYAELYVEVTSTGGGTGGGGGGGTGGGGGSKSGSGPGTNATYSKNWFQGADGLWKIRNKAGQVVTNAWLCDDVIPANGLNVWYLLDGNGNMVANGCVQDATGNIYSLEMNHNGYYGMLRYKNGTYTCEDGTTVYLEFSQQHDGTFGAVTNAAGIEFLKKKYGVTLFGIGNGQCQFTKSFE